jgi:hypothetical protein
MSANGAKADIRFDAQNVRQEPPAEGDESIVDVLGESPYSLSEK